MPRVRAPFAFCVAALLVATAAAGCKKGGSEPLRVAAASSLGPVLRELAADFTAETGTAVVLSLSSSGKLATQIEEGAPHDVFVSAAERWVDQVIAADVARPETKEVIAYGRVALWSLDREIEIEALRDAAFERIAIANPEHAPYGRAAREALQNAGLWPAVESRIVYGSNVQQAYQFAKTDNADAALTALSLVLTQGGRFTVVDDSLHAPLAQVAIVTAQSKREKDARAFIDFLGKSESRATLREYGLLQKGEKPDR